MIATTAAALAFAHQQSSGAAARDGRFAYGSSAQAATRRGDVALLQQA